MASCSRRTRFGSASRGITVIRPPDDALALPDNAQWTNRFYIRSETSDRLYTIAQNKSGRWWACSCFGWIRHRTCKHLRALGLPGEHRPFEAQLSRGSRG